MKYRLLILLAIGSFTTSLNVNAALLSTKNIIKNINNKEALCGKGKGFRKMWGIRCSNKSKAALAYLICKGYQDFANSGCAKKANKMYKYADNNAKLIRDVNARLANKEFLVYKVICSQPIIFEGKGLELTKCSNYKAPVYKKPSAQKPALKELPTDTQLYDKLRVLNAEFKHIPDTASKIIKKLNQAEINRIQEINRYVDDLNTDSIHGKIIAEAPITLIGN